MNPIIDNPFAVFRPVAQWGAAFAGDLLRISNVRSDEAVKKLGVLAARCMIGRGWSGLGFAGEVIIDLDQSCLP